VLATLFLAREQRDATGGSRDTAVQSYLVQSETVGEASLPGEGHVCRVPFNTDQMHVEAGSPCGHTGIIHPTTPAAAKFNDRKPAARQIHGAQRGAPFSDISVPVRWDWQAFDLSLAIFQKGWKERGVDPHAQEIGEIPV
jgi:hypothetical protein